MKRLICVLLMVLLSGTTELTTNECAEPGCPSLSNVSVVFSVSGQGKAQTAVTVTASERDTITIGIRVERKSGLLWLKVSGGEWSDTAKNTRYAAVTHDLTVAKEGKYRAVVTVSVQGTGESYERIAEAVYSKTSYQPGDVDRSGLVTASDARLILRFSAQLQSFDAEQKKLADIDGDGNVTASDARRTLRIAAKLG